MPVLAWEVERTVKFDPIVCVRCLRSRESSLTARLPQGPEILGGGEAPSRRDVTGGSSRVRPLESEWPCPSFPALPLTASVTLGKLCNFCEPQFPLLQEGAVMLFTSQGLVKIKCREKKRNDRHSLLPNEGNVPPSIFPPLTL